MNAVNWKRIAFWFVVTLLVGSMWVLSGCTDGDGARRVLEVDGVTDIEITGWRPFSCGEDDTFKTGFRGKKNGRPVGGAVCSGWFKGKTIRYD